MGQIRVYEETPLQREVKKRNWKLRVLAGMRGQLYRFCTGGSVTFYASDIIMGTLAILEEEVKKDYEIFKETHPLKKRTYKYRDRRKMKP